MHNLTWTPFGLFPVKNIQVTSFTWYPGDRNSRNECDLVVNPTDSDNIIAASKRFYDYDQYRFTIATAYTNDGGETWQKSADLTLLDGDESVAGYTDPALAMDPAGTAYLDAEPDAWTSLPDPKHVLSGGMAVFQSTNGGASWSHLPYLLEDRNASGDKQWATADNNPGSQFNGSVYAVWAADTPVWFSRKPFGKTQWVGAGTDNEPTAIFNDPSPFAPAICVSGDGTIHIAWHRPNTGAIMYMSSSDGGGTFSGPELCADDIGDITINFPLKPGADFPEFPGGTFRVLTLVSIAPIGATGCIVAWADARGSFTRIFYRIRSDEGVGLGDDSGTPLLGDMGFSDSIPVQHFHPQLAVTSAGIIGCAFYEFGEGNDGIFRIDVKLASTAVFSKGFFFLAMVTEKPWDPLIDAPFSHEDPAVTSLANIGEYFGLDVSSDDFCVLWADTRTLHQELWFARVATWQSRPGTPQLQPGLVGQFIGGAAVDGGGWIIVGGYPHPIPPSGPATEILQLLAANALVAGVKGAGARQIEQMIFGAISEIALRAGETVAES